MAFLPSLDPLIPESCEDLTTLQPVQRQITHQALV